MNDNRFDISKLQQFQKSVFMGSIKKLPYKLSPDAIKRIKDSVNTSRGWKSPIEINYDQTFKRVKDDAENIIYQEILNVGVNVDKYELLRALQYDRNQYEDGYRCGFDDAFEAIIDYFREMEDNS